MHEKNICKYIYIFLLLLITKIILNIHKKKIKIIDSFIYFQESQMLCVRLFRMNEFVDYFLIIVSNTTFSGAQQNISFSRYESFINCYRKKIIMYYVSHPLSCRNAWCREKYQRNSVSDAIKLLHIENESLILISDIDEIPTSNAMKYIIKYPPQDLYVLRGYIYYYNYRHKMNYNWSGVIVVKAVKCNNIQKYQDKRIMLSYKHSIPIYPSITHCSYCYETIELMIKKLKSFSHVEFNKPPYNTIEYITFCIKKHRNLFPNNLTLSVVEYDKKLLPLPNDKRFHNLIMEYGFK